jgi:chemotaxis protein CheZ
MVNRMLRYRRGIPQQVLQPQPEPPLPMNRFLSAAVVESTRAQGTAMPVQRKVFRIEEGARRRVGADVVGSPAAIERDALDRARAQIAEAQAYKRELGLIHAAVERTRDEVTALDADAPGGEQAARARRELRAIVGGTEQATQAILQAAEAIDEAADRLAASVKGSHDQGLARDIQDRVVQIFEACNFQDLTGQRVAHVAATLKFVEEHVARLMAIWQHLEQFTPVMLGGETGSERRLLNGPKLPGDRGHSTQDEIDGLFRCA